MVPGPDKSVHDALVALVAHLSAPGSLTLWNNMLAGGASAGHGYKPDDIAALRADFLNKPPTPRQGFARENDAWPVWAVILSQKSEQQGFCGKTGDIDPDTDCEILSHVVDQNVSITVYGRNPDVVRAHSLLIEGALLQSRDYFIDEGMADFNFQSMGDLMPDPKFSPEVLIWIREQVWSFTSEEKVLAALPEGWILHGPVYVGVSGVELGDAHVGRVEPDVPSPGGG